MRSPYGSLPYVTIKDKNKEVLERRIAEMEQREYEFVTSRTIFDGYDGEMHYAKMKNTRGLK